MKKFHFRLGPFLKFLEQQEQKKLMELSPFLARFNELVMHYDEMKKNCDAWVGQKNSDFFSFCSAQIKGLRFQMESIIKEKGELEKQMQPIRDDLLKIKKKKKGLELLKESQYKKWSKDYSKGDWQNKEDVFRMRRFSEQSMSLCD